eukprot:117711-Alexandrium_andersonii.AAC.1
MSASLVGSEMCIRDSTRAASGCPQCPPSRPAPQPPALAPPAARPLCSSCPVSYTHLTLPTICSV